MIKQLKDKKLLIRVIYQMIIMNISQYEKDKKCLINRGNNDYYGTKYDYYTFKDLDTNKKFDLCEGLPACDILVELCKRWKDDKEITIKELENIIIIFAGRYKILYLAKGKIHSDKKPIIKDVSECAEKYFGFIEAIKQMELSE